MNAQSAVQDRLKDGLHGIGRVRRLRPWLFVILTGLLVAGLRIAVGERFTTQLPYMDDWTNVGRLEQWEQGNHGLGFIFERHGSHFYAFSKAVSLLCFLANGAFDMRLEFLTYALVAGGYAAVVQMIFMRGLSGRQHPMLSATVVFLIGLPFAGHRISWGFLSGFAFCMTVSLLAIHLVVLWRDKWLTAVAALVLSVMATLSLGSGCLVCIAIVCIVALRSLLRRRLSGPDALLITASAALFLFAFLTMPHGGNAAARPSVVQLTLTFLKSVSWPNVFLPISGLVTLFPVGIFAWRHVRRPECRTPRNELILGIAILVGLQCAGMAVFRSDAGNFNMPSNRYTDILVLLPLLSLACLHALWQEGCPSLSVRLSALGAATLFAFGFSLHLLYRTWPFVARENGEWAEPPKVADLRQWQAGTPVILPDSIDETRDIFEPEILRRWILGAATNRVLSGSDIMGWSLSPLNAESTGFLRDAFHPAYAGRPAVRYWGSYQAEKRESYTAKFISKAFTASRKYIIIELMMDKRARFSAYQIAGAKLELVDDSDGSRADLLEKLSSSFPSLLRDRESVFAHVQPGRAYHIEAEDKGDSAWFAFSDPRPSGNCTPFTENLLQSGKWILLACSTLFVLLSCSPPILRRSES